jgi:hypothetical protein
MDRVRDLLGRVTDLSDQELTELRDLVLQQFDSADDEAGEAPDAAQLSILRELADATEAVNGEISNRNSARQERADLSAKRQAGIAELAVEDGEGGEGEEGAEGTEGAEGEGDAGDGEEGEGGEAVTASGGTGGDGKIEVPADRRPQPIRTKQAITASADVRGYSMGDEFPDAVAVGQAMCQKIEALKHVRGGDGEQVVVASIRLKDVPEERHLKQDRPEDNFRKVMDVIKPAAITAAGGFCAPLDVQRDFFGGGVTDRPVRDMLPSFTADRGGIRFVTSPTLAQLEGAVGIWTVQNDEDAALPDDPAAVPPFVSPTKPVLRVNCPAEVVVNTQAITMGLVFGNMQARAYPELVARNSDLAMVAHARIAEQQLLAQLGALSLHVTTPAQHVGAARTVLVQCDKAAAAYRNRHRTGSLPLRAIFPTWFKDLLRADIALQMPGGAIDTFSLADTMINSWFASRNINVTWALDGEAGQDYTAQADNAPIQEFPANVIWYLFVEGTFLFLDGGTLDLGIVRDSTLNAKNDYQTFVETFEAVAKVGHESLRVTSAIAPTGAAAALVAVAAGDL